MTLSIDVRSTRTIEPLQYIDHITNEVDLSDHDAVIASAEWLAALNNNKRFVLEMLNREAADCLVRVRSRFYSAHSLYVGSGKPAKGGVSFTVRVNLWPSFPISALAEIRRHAVEQVFAYKFPHDHNFNFLTVGYWGEGYETEIYEYDPATCMGLPGEAVDLVFRERTWLPEGKIMYYRCSRDVHVQLPPRSLSISLNLLVGLDGEEHVEQYEFDTSARRVADYIPASRITDKVILIEALAELGDGDSADMMLDVMKSHPARRVRAAALHALCRLQPDGIQGFASAAVADRDALVSTAARALLERGVA